MPQNLHSGFQCMAVLAFAGWGPTGRPIVQWWLAYHDFCDTDLRKIQIISAHTGMFVLCNAHLHLACTLSGDRRGANFTLLRHRNDSPYYNRPCWAGNRDYITRLKQHSNVHLEHRTPWLCLRTYSCGFIQKSHDFVSVSLSICVT